VNTVAQQVARQIESLRLLDNAERYRFEAEEASRRQTREGWKTYVQANADESMSYIYDLKEVRSFNQNGDQLAEESAAILPLKVRNETVGRLVVQGLASDDTESLALASAVAERLGAHIESLRQYDQTQSALTQSEKLFEASRLLTQASDLQELVKATVETLNISVVNRAILGIFSYNAAGELETMTDIANWSNGTGTEVAAIGTSYSAKALELLSVFLSDKPLFFNDTFTDERMGAAGLQVAKGLNIRAGAVLPLFLGTRQLGILMLQAEQPHNFSQDEIRLYSALAPQISTVLENRRQFERAQKQAEREGTLNVISQKIQSATTVEAVLQIAARELGHALGAPMTIAQLSMKDKK
jgi:GAF domain-containing protein